MNKAFSDEKSSPISINLSKKEKARSKNTHERRSEKISGTEAPLKKRKKITASYLENSGAYYLQRFSSSVARFRQVMTRKIDLSCRDHPEQDKEQCLEMLNQLISKFIEMGYLNDESFSKGLYYSLSQRGYSRQKILFQMKSKGLSDDHIMAAIGDNDEEQELIQAVRYTKRKKIGAFAIREQDFQKSLASLARNGFGYDIATRALQMDEEDALDILHKLS
ncbi:MAG TPA: regulatory protein RecX [Alphaproteobacteria bacterium]|nr:regulatory protein RecX [Alphaproteobacteria bacterium]